MLIPNIFIHLSAPLPKVPIISTENNKAKLNYIHITIIRMILHIILYIYNNNFVHVFVVENPEFRKQCISPILS